MRRAVLPFLVSLALVGCGGGGGSTPSGGFTDPPGGQTRGTLVSSTLLEDYSWEDLDGVLTYEEVDIDAEVDVSLYNITYWTIDAKGSPYLASGAVAIPDGATAADLISYQHSTATQKTNVPGSNNDEAEFICAVFASGGNYVVAMPDYVGLGTGAGFHPFLHAPSEASASMDAIRAARTLAKQQSVTLGNDLFLTGYSQGGHATMALAKAIQALNTTEFQPTAVGAGSGPYAPLEVELPFAFSTPSADSSTFLSYIVLAYETVFGNVYGDINEVFPSPYDLQVPGLFNGQNDLDTIAAALPNDPNSLFTPSFVESLFSDTATPFRTDLQNAAELWNWVPTVQTQLYAAQSDEVVSFQNSQNAYDYMSGQGAPVTLVNMGNNLTHVEGIAVAMPDARIWFDQIAGYTTPTLKNAKPKKKK